MFGQKKPLKNRLVVIHVAENFFNLRLFAFAFFFDWTHGNVDTLLYTYDAEYFRHITSVVCYGIKRYSGDLIYYIWN